MSNSGPLLGVVVPVSNMAGNLSKLQDWLEDSYCENIEIIIVHDFQDSETEDELRQIVHGKGSKVKMISGTFGSPGLARNKGIALLESEWVAFWDSDDSPLVRNILGDLNKFNLDQLDALVGGFEVRNASTGELLSTNLNDSKCSQNRIAKNPGIWRWVFKRTLISNLQFPNLSMGEDQIFIARSRAIYSRVKYSNSIYYQYYRGYKSQLTSNKKKISQITSATQLLVEDLENPDFCDSRFHLQLIACQMQTAILRGSIKTRIKTLKLLLEFMRPLRIARLRTMLQQILYNIWSR
jgi:glycosyltransferase involved in cell wall biosynthesis